MAGSQNQSDMNNPNAEERGRRMRIIWLSSIANLTLIVVLTGLWLQGAFIAQHMIILALAVFLIVNGALWLGWRIDRARRRANRPLKPLFLLVIGGLAIQAVLPTLPPKITLREECF
jgi:hypothetical protein